MQRGEKFGYAPCSPSGTHALPGETGTCFKSHTATVRIRHLPCSRLRHRLVKLFTERVLFLLIAGLLQSQICYALKRFIAFHLLIRDLAQNHHVCGRASELEMLRVDRHELMRVHDL
jgi:hypothetical protein